jgi:hypothetical protein
MAIVFADDDAGPRDAFLVAGREGGRIISRRRLCLLVAAEVLAFAQRLVSGCDRNGYVSPPVNPSFWAVL